MPSAPPSHKVAHAAAVTGDNPPTWVNAVFRPLRLAKLTVIVGVVALMPYLIQRLPSLAGRPEYRLATKQIRIVPMSERPVPENLLEQVRELGKLPRELSMLDETLSAKVADAFARHPWIARVVSVRKSYPANITVELEYRQPVGMVQVKGGPFPIDVAGVVLPPADKPAPAPVPAPSPKPEPGTPPPADSPAPKPEPAKPAPEPPAPKEPEAR